MSGYLSPVLYIPHGGGPLPLLDDLGHSEMVAFLRKIAKTMAHPTAILLISAHWEEEIATITHSHAPKLIYDYYGFPDKAYRIEYPALGDPKLADKVYSLLQNNNINARLDAQRGFDHGMFVPLKIMYPDAQIPCVQLSLVKGLDAEMHIQIGKALSELRKENILILGSGFSFHNLQQLIQPGSCEFDDKNEVFQSWLNVTCTDSVLTQAEREQKLINWSEAPHARYCHPREEHLMPLHVCYGVSGGQATNVFNGMVMGKKTSAFLW